MEISAVMNIQELAVNKAVRLHAETQEKNGKTTQHKELQGANETGSLGNRTALEKDPGVLSNTARQQMDPQLTSTKVERQVDAQAAKETAPGAEGENRAGESLKETGNFLDIIT